VAAARIERAGWRSAFVFADGVRFAGAPQRTNEVRCSSAAHGRGDRDL